MMRLGDLDALSEKMKGTNMYFDIKFDIDEMPTIDPETLPIVKELRAEVKRLNKGIESLSKNVEIAYKQRDAAVNDLRECAIEDYAECIYCSRRDKDTLCQNCTNGSNWEWHGVQEE